MHDYLLMQRIAIIPARGGSKRIPKKNIIDFCGKPMIAWTIEAALRSKLFNQVVVSTDSREIANVAEQFGAAVPFLRKEKFDDFASVSEATISALKQSEAFWKTHYDSIVQLMANCPLRDCEHILDALHTFENCGAEYQISCVRFAWMNPWWASTLDDHSLPHYLFPNAMAERSQDLPPLFCPTGAIWIASRTALLSAGSFYGPKHRYHPMNWRAAIDIDDYEDLKMANALAMVRNRPTILTSATGVGTN